MTFDNIYLYILFDEILLRNLENIGFFFDEAIKIFLIELIFGKLSFSQFPPIAADRHEFEIFNSFYHRCCMLGGTLLNYYDVLFQDTLTGRLYITRHTTNMVVYGLYLFNGIVLKNDKSANYLNIHSILSKYMFLLDPYMDNFDLSLFKFHYDNKLLNEQNLLLALGSKFACIYNKSESYINFNDNFFNDEFYSASGSLIFVYLFNQSIDVFRSVYYLDFLNFETNSFLYLLMQSYYFFDIIYIIYSSLLPAYSINLGAITLFPPYLSGRASIEVFNTLLFNSINWFIELFNLSIKDNNYLFIFTAVFSQNFEELSRYSYVGVSINAFFDTPSFVLHNFAIESFFDPIIDNVCSNVIDNIYFFVILYFADYNLSDYNLSNYNSMCRTYLTSRKLNYQ
jgi:hypothetical protein